MAMIDEPLGAWLDALASNAPAPGGGAAAALCGALGAALVTMVGRFTVGRPKYAEYEEQVQKLLRNSERAREMLTTLMDADAKAFHMVALAYRMPKKTAEEKAKREEIIQEALAAASDVPVMVAEIAREVITMAELMANMGNRSVLVDVGSAVYLSIAAMQAATLNVRENLRHLHDEVHAHALQKRLSAVMEGVEESAAETLAIIAARTQD
jgi:formiminotetrahydrofolate cyclodeaminase